MAVSQEFQRFYSRLLVDTMDSGDIPPCIYESYHIDACLSLTDDKQIYQLTRISDGAACILKGTAPERGDSAAKEAGLLRLLDHPGIPKVYDAFSWNGRDYLVRQFFEGKTLDRLVSHNGPFPAEKVLEIGMEVAAIVGYLHRADPPLIHRDIKPQNLIMAPDGHICLIDFGISRQFDEHATHDTVYLGSFGYASPEQFGFSRTDPRTDIFAIGGLLYYLSTGRQKEYAANGSDISCAPLRRIIRRCTQLDSSRRFADAKQLHSALYRARKTGFGQYPRLRHYLGVGVLVLLLLVAENAIWLGIEHSASGASSGMTAELSELTSPPLLAAVRAELGLQPDDAVTDSHLALVTALSIGSDSPAGPDADHETLTQKDLSQLALFPALRELTLAHRNIASLSSIPAGLPLEALDLSKNNITSLEAVKNFPALRRLNLSGNPITDTAPLSALQELEHLDLSYTEITQADPLRQLSTLRSLDLSGTRITALSGHTNLKTLRLAYCPIRDYSFLSALAELEVLDLHGAAFGEIRFLPDEGLRELDVSWNYNYLTNLDGIERLQSLESLDLSFTGATDLSALSGLPSLHTLRLNSSLRQLPELPALRTLYITGEENRDYWTRAGQDRDVEVILLPKPTINDIN